MSNNEPFSFSPKPIGCTCPTFRNTRRTWNPDEKVWNHLKHQELKSHQAKTKEELKSLAQDKLENMSLNPSLPRGIFFRCCVAEFFG